MSHGEDRYHREHRVTPFRLWYPTVAYTIASVGLVLRMATQGVPAVVTIPVAVLFAALLVWMFTALRAGATVVDERGVTIRRPRLYGGNLVLHWPDIQGIKTRMNPAFGQRGAPRVMVVLYIAGNRRYLLPHVHDRNGLDVAQEVATLRGLWTLGRGEDWRPDPETAAKIAYTRKHPVPLALVALLGGDHRLCHGDRDLLRRACHRRIRRRRRARVLTAHAAGRAPHRGIRGHVHRRRDPASRQATTPLTARHPAAVSCRNRSGTSPPSPDGLPATAGSRSRPCRRRAALLAVPHKSRHQACFAPGMTGHRKSGENGPGRGTVARGSGCALALRKACFGVQSCRHRQPR